MDLKEIANKLKKVGCSSIVVGFETDEGLGVCVQSDDVSKSILLIGGLIHAVVEETELADEDVIHLAMQASNVYDMAKTSKTLAEVCMEGFFADMEDILERNDTE